MTTLPLREHRYLGMTQSLCPTCREVVPAKILSRAGRIYFRKTCRHHGIREDFVCSDERWYDRMEFSLAGKTPLRFAIQPDRGCPYDCGLCTEHEQHTCVAVLEITSSCNLTCPLCYASSAPGGQHLSLDECRASIDHLVACEGNPEILQLSGGEPTIHPDFLSVLRYALEQPIQCVMINTNGVRIARDSAFIDALTQLPRRCEVYLQFDGFHDSIHQTLRGESLLELKLRAIEQLGQAGLNVTLVSTVEAGVNLDQVGDLLRFGAARPWITGICFQPATYVGRYVPPATLEHRVTFPDIVRAAEEQTNGFWRTDDFLPLPCAHPNAHTLAYAYRDSRGVIPLTRFLDIRQHLDLLANGIAFQRARVQDLVREFLARNACGVVPCDGPQRSSIGAESMSTRVTSDEASHEHVAPFSQVEQDLARSFIERALRQDLHPSDMLRITINSFMDPYNFDVRQLMKSCVHHVLPSGHLIPFCAYNSLYRDGHVPLPPLAAARVHERMGRQAEPTWI